MLVAGHPFQFRDAAEIFQIVSTRREENESYF